MTQVRHYVIPFFVAQHHKSGAVQLIVLLQGKVATSPAHRDREGKVSLFGGGAKAEEDRAACLKREVREELPALLDFLPREPAGWDKAPPVCDDDYPYTLTSLYCGEWSQAVYRKLAESCRDGYVLAVGLDGIDKFMFCTSKMRGNVYEELYELMVDVRDKAKTGGEHA